MPEFLNLNPPLEALNVYLAYLQITPTSEVIDTSEALGRITYEAYEAPHPLPAFRRSTVDGYAVRAEDTFGASPALPAYLEIIGEILMGTSAVVATHANQCALIHTGGMLPDGADAVVMIEHTQTSRQDEAEIMKPVAVGENVIEVGEDIKQGEEVLPAGIRLRPAEIGGLMALGFDRVRVSRRPKVGVLSSGDEVISPHQEPKPGQVRDINSYTLSAFIEQSGGFSVRFGVIEDEFDAMRIATERAIRECDLVLITAGSSASTRDLTARVIDDLGEPGVLVHGVNIRPGKPTILGICDNKPVIGLPGNPVSALVIARIFVQPVIERYLGLKATRPAGTIDAKLGINLASSSGREEWIPVRLMSEGSERIAEPIFGKSNLIFTLVKADGLIRIPPDATGLATGEAVRIHLL